MKDQPKVVVINSWCKVERYSTTAGIDYDRSGAPLVFNVTISSGVTSSSFDVDIINNTVQEQSKMFSIRIRLISTCLPIIIKSDTTSVTIIDDEGMTFIVFITFCNIVISLYYAW